MELLYQGKTKDIYQGLNQSMILKFKDDVTGTDGKFDPGANQIGLSIEGMGNLNLRLTTFFFQLLNQTGIPTHFIASNLNENTMTVKSASVFGKGLEVITRFKATGSFIRRYGEYIEDGAKLNNYVELTLKDDKRQDPLVTKDGLNALNILTNKQYEILIDLNIQIAQIIQKKLAEHGFELYDIKLEFGYVNHPDNIILIDEISGGNMRVYKEGQLVDPIELAQYFNDF
ncbi:MAG: phosphoribosylaminoimidazolesuccinocarboxamide synthase [Ruoffia tabacinasalis]|uniref:phosphoribosylaminoimidazolesuccinocarboxamide synthase n=1 Tax=Ruoffia sp. FAM 26255 TaxID=3259519 RepID=UPI00388A2538